VIKQHGGQGIMSKMKHIDTAVGFFFLLSSDLENTYFITNQAIKHFVLRSG
jgi:hypothetical protein